MAKTTRPDRKKHDRRRREPSEFEETTLAIDRVTRVVKGGRRMRFRAVVVVGDKKGRVGLGTGKATEVQSAVQKATACAKRDMLKIPLVEGTIPHAVDNKFKAARIRLLPARAGTGVIAGGALRVILEHAGVKNVLSKRFGTNNKLVNAQCVMEALQMLKGEYKAPSGSTKVTADTDDEKQDASKKSNKEIGLQETPELEQLAVKEVTKKEAGVDEKKKK